MILNNSLSRLTLLLAALLASINFKTSANASPTRQLPSTSLPQTPAITPPVRTIYGFPVGVWLENLVVRSNGSILTTELTTPRLWHVDPFDTSTEPELIHEFEGYLGVLGIVETTPDVFVLIAGNFSLAPETTSYPGTYTVWKVDFNTNRNGAGWGDWAGKEKGRTGGRGGGCNNQHNPRIEKVADVPDAQFLNGMAYLGEEQDAVLLADSWAGVLWRLDLSTGEYYAAISDPLLTRCSINGKPALEGVNGLKRYGDKVYFTRGFCSRFVEVDIFPNGTASNTARVIGIAPNSTWTWDDFVVDDQGNAYVAVGYNNLVTKITPNGELSVVAGNLNSTEIAEPTALAFGRTQLDLDRRTVYVTTGGALGDPINGSITIGGQLLAIDLAL